MKNPTISYALSIGNQKLQKITGNYINETFWILSKCINKDKKYLLLNKQSNIHLSQFNDFLSLLNRRLQNEPLQSILESVLFYGYEFITYKDVFIARPETELCIDIIKEYNDCYHSILEVGCGLGCLAITLSLEGLSRDITAIDINVNAIYASHLNYKHLNASHIKFMNQDIFYMNHNKRYNLIISNPPYIPISDVQNLDSNVILYDPLSSLTDFDDGLSFYKYFSKIGPTLLLDGGLMLFEFGGHMQKELLHDIFNKKYYKLKFFNDLNHEPRFLGVQLCN
tara:strand:- start:1612 stop:2457 length:846 start_codon:yes stop_codon:yes gene_type:complete